MNNKVSDAQSHIDGTTVASMIIDFQNEFREIYPDHILSHGVGPLQSLIGLAIKNGHITLPENGSTKLGRTGRTRYRIEVEKSWFKKPKQYLVLQHEVIRYGYHGEYITVWVDSKPEWMLDNA